MIVICLSRSIDKGVWVPWADMKHVDLGRMDGNPFVEHMG